MFMIGPSHSVSLTERNAKKYLLINVRASVKEDGK